MEPGQGHTRNDFIKEQGIKTYLVVKKKNDGSNNNMKLSSMSEVSVALMMRKKGSLKLPAIGDIIAVT